MADSNQLRFERLFSEILADLQEPQDKHTRSIVRALEIVALELSELNVAASALMDAPSLLKDAIHHLEQIDSQTEEVADYHRSQT